MKKNILIFLLLTVIVVETIVGFTYINSIKKTDIFYHADTTEEIDELRTLGKPLIVVFGADYCPTCINYKPYVKECAELFDDNVIVKYVDTVEHESIRNEYNIEFVPSTLFFDANGNPYQPSSKLSVEAYDEEVIEDREYVSDQFRIADKDELDLNVNFEYGLTENNELGYTKYVGLLDIIQLEEIIFDLMKW